MENLKILALFLREDDILAVCTAVVDNSELELAAFNKICTRLCSVGRLNC